VLTLTQLRIVALHYLHRAEPAERRRLVLQAAAQLFQLPEACEAFEHRVGAETSYGLMVIRNR
jgi:ABC-type antimicrobial peptide transport system ATPase subunit